MKKLSFILILIASYLQVSAQFRHTAGLDNQSNELTAEKKVDYTLSAGTTFISSPGYAKGSVFYLAPEFKLKLSPKFSVDAGIMLMQNRLSYSTPSSIFGEQSVVVKSSPSYDGMAYATGNYSFNSRLTLSGTLVKSFTPAGSYQDVGWKNSFQMMSFGVNYKITDNMSIGGGVHFIQSNGFNPYSGYNYVSPGLGVGPFNSFSDPARY